MRRRSGRFGGSSFFLAGRWVNFFMLIAPFLIMDTFFDFKNNEADRHRHEFISVVVLSIFLIAWKYADLFSYVSQLE